MFLLSCAINAPYNYDLSENKIHKPFQIAVDVIIPEYDFIIFCQRKVRQTVVCIQHLLPELWLQWKKIMAVIQIKNYNF